MNVIDGRTVLLDEKDLIKLFEGEILEDGQNRVAIGFITNSELPVERKKVAAFGTSYHVYISSELFHKGIEEVFVLPVPKEEKSEPE